MMDARIRWADGWVDLCEKLAEALTALSEDVQDGYLSLQLDRSARLAHRSAGQLAEVVARSGEDAGARPTVVGSLFRLALDRETSDGDGGDLEAAEDAEVLLRTASEMGSALLVHLGPSELGALVLDQARALGECAGSLSVDDELPLAVNA